MLAALQDQGVSTAKLYMGRAAHYLGGLILNTAVRGGGGLVQTLRNSYSLTDLSQGLEWSRGRFTDLSEESGELLLSLSVELDLESLQILSDLAKLLFILLRFA